MKELPEEKDLRHNKRVIEAGKGLGVAWVKYADNIERLRGSLADVAFEMRDACIKRGWEWKWAEKVEHVWTVSKPQNWIWASVLTWEARKELPQPEDCHYFNACSKAGDGMCPLECGNFEQYAGSLIPPLNADDPFEEKED